MSRTPASPPPYAFRVVIEDAHLEFIVDGEGSHTALLFGTVADSNLSEIPTGFPMDITLGDIQPENYGLIVNDQSGGLFYDMAPAQVAGFTTLASIARGGRGAFYVNVALPDNGRLLNDIGRHWGAPQLSLSAHIALMGKAG